MTNHTQRSAKPPSPAQQDLLQKLEDERGVSFGPPATSKEASQKIRSLLAMERSFEGRSRRDLSAIRADLAIGSGCVALIHDDEIGGYGSTARWR